MTDADDVRQLRQEIGLHTDPALRSELEARAVALVDAISAKDPLEGEREAEALADAFREAT
jgi:hypothetical protein